MSEYSKTADKAIAILVELGATRWVTPQKLATRMDTNRTVVQRLLTTLVHSGYVTRQDGEYALSWRVRRLAASVQPRLREAASPHLADLSEKTRETVVLQVIDAESAVVLDEAVHSSGVRLQARHEIGSRSPLASSASGLALLAALDDKQASRLLGIDVEGDQPGIARRLAGIREQGIVYTTDELQQGVSGVAVALQRGDGEPPASVAVIAPTSRANDLRRHAEDLQRAAAKIERALRSSM